MLVDSFFYFIGEAIMPDLSNNMTEQYILTYLPKHSTSQMLTDELVR